MNRLLFLEARTLESGGSLTLSPTVRLLELCRRHDLIMRRASGDRSLTRTSLLKIMGYPGVGGWYQYALSFLVAKS